MRRKATAFLIAAIGLMAAGQAEEGFIEIFDGETLDGWVYSKKRGSGYTISEGKIVCPPDGGGDLLTEKEYADFVLRFEFKLFDGSNNGLGIRAPMNARDVAYEGIELQIIDSRPRDTRTSSPGRSTAPSITSSQQRPASRNRSGSGTKKR